jgi:hypothetical protein
MATTLTTAKVGIALPVTMRIAPTAIDYSLVAISDQFSAAASAVLGINAVNLSRNYPVINADYASNFAAGRPVDLVNDSNAAGYVGLSAEL